MNDRVIRFRGKTTEEDSFVYGLPTYKPWGLCIQLGNMHGCFVTIKPETLGQNTGLKDKHGEDIYEGDELCNGKFVAVVKYKQANARFEAVETDGPHRVLANKFNQFTVVGNIHENNTTEKGSL